MCVASMILVCLVSICIGLHLTASHLACCLSTGFLRTQPHAGFLFRSEPNQAQQILNVCTLLDEEAGGHILLVGITPRALQVVAVAVRESGIA